MLACGDEVTFAEAEGTHESGDETGETSSGESTSETGETGETATGESTSETGDPPPACGDGVLDPDEECDDGNTIAGDGCSEVCESACGTRGWLDLTVPAGWFDIHRLVPSSGGQLLALGELVIADEPGRVRVVRALDNQVLDAIESAPLGPAGTLELPQTHRVDVLARAPEGDAILVLGTSTEVLVAGEQPVARTWLARLATDTLVEQWRVEIPVDAPELRPLDLALLAGGDVIVTRTVEQAANDRDLGFERRSGVDGSVVWTSSFSGPLEAGWSLDRAGRVAVGPDDRVWAAGIVRIDWQTYETTLLELDPLTGAVTWSAAPLPDPGNTHEQRIVSLAAGPGGRVAVGIDVLGPSTPNDYAVAFGHVEGELVWTLRREDLPWAAGDPYVTPTLAFDEDGDALVVGRYTHDFGTSTATRPWVVALGPEGSLRCAAQVGEGNLAALVPAIGFFEGGLGALNLDTYGPGGMGPMSGGNWVAPLRGW